MDKREVYSHYQPAARTRARKQRARTRARAQMSPALGSTVGEDAAHLGQARGAATRRREPATREPAITKRTHIVGWNGACDHEARSSAQLDSSMDTSASSSSSELAELYEASVRARLLLEIELEQMRAALHARATAQQLDEQHDGQLDTLDARSRTVFPAQPAHIADSTGSASARDPAGTVSAAAGSAQPGARSGSAQPGARSGSAQPGARSGTAQPGAHNAN